MMKYKTKGFTLIELLLVSMLIIFIGFGIYRVFCSGWSMYSWLELNKPQNDSVIFFEKIAFDVENFCNLPEYRFRGDENHMAFYVHDAGYMTLSADKLISDKEASDLFLYRVEYTFDSKAGQVVRRVFKYNSEKALKKTVVLSNVRNVTFKYYVKEYYTGELRDFFPLTDRLPDAVKVSVQVAEKNDQVVFERIITVPFMVM